VGWETSLNDRDGLLSIRPEDAQPHWVTVPYLYALCRASPGLIPSLGVRKPGNPNDKTGAAKSGPTKSGQVHPSRSDV
jgi:hypothetical protein